MKNKIAASLLVLSMLACASAALARAGRTSSSDDCSVDTADSDCPSADKKAKAPPGS